MISLFKSATTEWQRLIYALVAANGLSVLLFIVRVYGASTTRYWFMLWNLVLALVPLLLAASLSKRLTYERWLSPINLCLTVLWLVFLPNSFYVLSDLIHLQTTGEINILFDTVMFFSFICNSYIAGLWSVYIVHRELRKRLSGQIVMTILAAVFLLSGFAIYMGRVLRWNSWDVFMSPFGVLFDVSEGIINPLAHPQAFVTTGTFFLLLSTLYAVVYQFVQVVRVGLVTKKPKRRVRT